MKKLTTIFLSLLLVLSISDLIAVEILRSYIDFAGGIPDQYRNTEGRITIR